MRKTTDAGRPIRIGQLARDCSVSPDTLRHYERLKLLRPAGRSPSGYRFYALEAIARVRIVQAALSLGFTLAELSRLLGMRDAGQPPCHAVRALAAEKLTELERRLKDIVRLRASLRAVLKSWDVRLQSAPAGARAGLLDSLVSGDLDLNLPPRTSMPKRIKRRSPK
jgi:MerR family transcriptional regulator, copper efflux regulator